MVEDVRTTVRVTHVYTLGGCLPDEAGQPLQRLLDIGRYGLHNGADVELGLYAHHEVELPPGTVVLDGAAVLDRGQATARLWTDGKGLAQLHVVHEQDTSPEDAARTLGVMCHKRLELTVDGRSIADWVWRAWDCVRPPELLQDVLQLVEVPTALAASAHAEREADGMCQAVLRLLYRSPDEVFDSCPPSIRFPAELNRNAGDLGAHGRGVFVVGGHQEHQVNALLLMACRLLFGLARLRIVRCNVEERLREVRDSSSGTHRRWDDEAFLRAMMSTVRQQRVSLTFGVRAWTDGLFLPDLVLDDFRRSFSGTLRIDEMEASTSTMLETLADVAESSLQQAQLESAKRVEERQGRFQQLVGLASAVTLPLALLLSYFGVASQVQAPPEVSIFSPRQYWLPWVVTGTVMTVSYLCWRAARRNDDDPARRRGDEGGEPVRAMISAHRCGAGLDTSRENTLGALEAAVRLDVDFVEFDVQRCADDRFVLFHDAEIEIDGVVKPLLEVPSDAVLKHAEQVVAYEVALEVLRAHGKKAHIDFKQMGTRKIDGLAPEVAATQRAIDVLGEKNIIVTTLEDASVRAVRAWSYDEHPDLLVGLSLGRDVSPRRLVTFVRTRLSEVLPGRRLRACRANLVVAHRSLAKAFLWRWARKNRLPLLVWTVDADDELRYWLDRDDVFLVTTNHPEQALSLRTSPPARS